MMKLNFSTTSPATASIGMPEEFETSSTSHETSSMILHSQLSEEHATRLAYEIRAQLTDFLNENPDSLPENLVNALVSKLNDVFNLVQLFCRLKCSYEQQIEQLKDQNSYLEAKISQQLQEQIKLRTRIEEEAAQADENWRQEYNQLRQQLDNFKKENERLKIQAANRSFDEIGRAESMKRLQQQVDELKYKNSQLKGDIDQLTAQLTYQLMARKSFDEEIEKFAENIEDNNDDGDVENEDPKNGHHLTFDCNEVEHDIDCSINNERLPKLCIETVTDESDIEALENFSQGGERLDFILASNPPKPPPPPPQPSFKTPTKYMRPSTSHLFTPASWPYSELSRTLDLSNISIDEWDYNELKDSSPEEIHARYESILLAIRTDKLTLSQRLEVQERQRIVAEQDALSELNILSEEINQLNSYLSSYNPEDIDSRTECRNLLFKIQRHADILKESVRVVSGRSECFGAVKQESRVAATVDTIHLHVDNLKRARDHDRQELEEAKRQLAALTAALPPSQKDRKQSDLSSMKSRTLRSISATSFNGKSGQQFQSVQQPTRAPSQHPVHQRRGSFFGTLAESTANIPKVISGVIGNQLRSRRLSMPAVPPSCHNPSSFNQDGYRSFQPMSPGERSATRAAFEKAQNITTSSSSTESSGSNGYIGGPTLVSTSKMSTTSEFNISDLLLDLSDVEPHAMVRNSTPLKPPSPDTLGARSSSIRDQARSPTFPEYLDKLISDKDGLDGLRPTSSPLQEDRLHRPSLSPSGGLRVLPPVTDDSASELSSHEPDMSSLHTQDDEDSETTLSISKNRTFNDSGQKGLSSKEDDSSPSPIDDTLYNSALLDDDYMPLVDHEVLMEDSNNNKPLTSSHISLLGISRDDISMGDAKLIFYRDFFVNRAKDILVALFTIVGHLLIFACSITSKQIKTMLAAILLALAACLIIYAIVPSLFPTDVPSYYTWEDAFQTLMSPYVHPERQIMTT